MLHNTSSKSSYDRKVKVSPELGTNVSSLVYSRCLLACLFVLELAMIHLHVIEP